MTKTAFPTRRTVLAGAVALAGMAGAVHAAPPQDGAAKDGGTGAAGTVKRVQGAVLAVRDAAPRPLAPGDAVFVGDVLSTGPGARLEVAMIDDGVFTLGEKTAFVIIDYAFSGDEPVLRLLSGAMAGVTGAITAKAGGMTMHTEAATIGIRGTTFWGGELNGVTQVALLDGKAVVVENKAGRVVIDTPGFGTKIKDDRTAPTAPHDWGQGMLNRAGAMTSF